MADLLIDHARVLDGTGVPAFDGWVLVRGDRIAAIGRGGPPVDGSAGRVDARGHVLAPGFVDVHNHSDLVPFVEPWMDSSLRQGCTTLVVGNCGSSGAPPAGAAELATLVGVPPDELDLSWPTFEDFLERLEETGPALNVASLVGHGAVRMQVIGTARRAPTEAESDRMRGLVREAMEAGAVGLSSGLVYIPGMHADTVELATLAAEIAPFAGVYASHIRGEGAMLFDAIEEAIEIARRAGIPAHVSHLKLEGARVWGRVQEVLETLEHAREGGADVSADQYPYAAWASGLVSFLPPWAPPEQLPAILADESAHARLRVVVAGGEPGWQSSVDGVGWERVVVESHIDASANGRSVADIAADRRRDSFETAFAMLVADPETAVIGHAMAEDDVRAILGAPDVLVASDSSAMSPDGPLGNIPVHPRTYGTFPRVIGRYVRDGALDLSTAVRKMTSLPADRFGLAGRGRIAEGGFADLVVFDPTTVVDSATFESPHSFASGVELVVVNGEVAWDGARGTRAGRVLRGSGR